MTALRVLCGDFLLDHFALDPRGSAQAPVDASVAALSVAQVAAEFGVHVAPGHLAVATRALDPVPVLLPRIVVRRVVLRLGHFGVSRSTAPYSF